MGKGDRLTSGLDKVQLPLGRGERVTLAGVVHRETAVSDSGDGCLMVVRRPCQVRETAVSDSGDGRLMIMTRPSQNE